MLTPLYVRLTRKRGARIAEPETGTHYQITTIKMETLKKEISFIDADNKRARVTAEITKRNGYPEFTLSGQYTSSHGQVIDHIKPANDDQRELVQAWKSYHLKDVSGVPGFREYLDALLSRIEKAETEREDKKLEGDAAILENMDHEGIEEDQLEAVKAYVSVMGTDDLSDFQESYAGDFMDDRDFARDVAESMGAINDDLEWPHTCIDWEQAARELMQDYSEEGGYYFRNI